MALIYLPALVKAVLIIWVWLKLISRVSRITNRALTKAKLDITIRKFTINLLNMVLKVMLVLSIAWVFGIPTTSFIALLWAAGLAVGLSLQGSLSNFAWWVLILILKPYKIGDVIGMQWTRGRVDAIGVFSTTITTVEKNTVIIPNGKIINDNITNLSSNPLARIDVQVWISYNANIDEARTVLLDVLTNNTFIVDDEPKEVLVEGLWDSSVNLIVRWFSLDADYFNAFYSLNEEVKKWLDAANINIPYPHRVMIGE
jgi:small conductance mechanosensitive channel